MSEEKKIKNNELNNDELKKVSGGDWFASDNDYKSGSTPLFKVGDWVEYFSTDTNSYGLDKGQIKEVSSSRTGWFNLEFKYTIYLPKFDREEEDVYESQIVNAEKLMDAYREKHSH